MNHKEYRFLVNSDLHRYAGNSSFSSFLRNYILEPGFRYSYWMRTCSRVKDIPVLKTFLFPLCWFILHQLELRFGISISYKTRIGSGFYIGHFGGIIVNSNAVIGKNCNISHLVTLGITNRGEKKGVPIICDNVYIGPGAKIIGNIRVGNNAAIGANCVVTKDVPDNAVVVGVPGKIISFDGSLGYINRTDYKE